MNLKFGFWEEKPLNAMKMRLVSRKPGTPFNLPPFIISVEAATAPDLAEEIGQMILIKKLAKEGFVVSSFENHAIIEFANVPKDFEDAIDLEIADWITHKHSTLKKRKLGGTRKKLSLNISDQTNDELVCIEIRPALRK